MERCLTPVTIRGIQVKSTLRTCFTSQTNKSVTRYRVGRLCELQQSHSCLQECNRHNYKVYQAKIYQNYKYVYSSFRNLTSGEHPLATSQIYIPANKMQYVQMLFVTARDLKQFKGASLENWENKLWCLNKNEENKDYICICLICIKKH